MSAILLYGCGSEAALDNWLDEAWGDRDNPELLGTTDMNFRFNELPLAGEVDSDNVAWSDNYWPHYRGGISYRWPINQFAYSKLNKTQIAYSDLTRLSPAEKYDIFMGRYDFPTVRSERARTQVLRTDRSSRYFDESFEIPTWEGLCHGWAPAALNFKQPNPIVVQSADGVNVPFGSADLKALLGFYQQYRGNRSVRTYFMSQRCNESFDLLEKKLENQEISQEEYHRRKYQGPCAGVNAGAFHLVLTNKIGLNGNAFIADITRDAEVWNQPVSAFESVIVDERFVASPGAATGTVQEIHIRSVMSYVVETVPSWNPHLPAKKSQTYEYIIELNADGEIIGGQWISEERPDFLWNESKPVFRGYFRGLEYLYERSLEAG